MLICGKSHAVLRGTSSDYGSWSNWAYYSLDSRGLCLGHSVLPLPSENRRLSMGFSCDMFFFQFKHTDGLIESQHRCILLVLLQVGMTGYLSFLGVQRAQHAAPPKRHCVAPYSRMYSRLSLSKATALTRHYGLRCARVNSNGSSALIANHHWQYMATVNGALGIMDFFPCRQHALVHYLKV